MSLWFPRTASSPSLRLQGKVGCWSCPSICVGLSWMLGTEGLISGTRRCGTVFPPSMPNPHAHPSAPRSGPASEERSYRVLFIKARAYLPGDY